jgi:glycosyltransferase involved in cell wall biosynthesis
METQAQSLAEGLVARSHEVTVLTTPHPDRLSEGVEGTVAVRYISPGTYRRYTKEWWEACYQHLCQLHQARPVDVLLSQSAGALGYMPRVAADLRIPIVVVIHGSTTGELRTRLRSAGSLRGLYRLARQLELQPRLFVLWRKAAPMVDRWIVVSHETAREWQREQPVAPERVVVIPNGIDTTRFCPDGETRSTVRARYGIPDEVPLLLCVGRLEYEKGFQVAIQALAMLQKQFHDIRLVIAGEGIYRKPLERVAATMQGAVTLAGYVPNQDVPSLLAAADIFLMPTLRDEGFPMTVVEAMASGLPVVASRVGGIPSAIDDGHTGMLVPMGNAEACAQATEQLLRDRPLRAAMQQAARQAAVAHFSRDHMIQATERVLHEVVAHHAR